MLNTCKYTWRVAGKFGQRWYTQGNVKAECYISTLNDPYLNLAIEDWLMRVTDPTRNQNPFLECNLSYMNEHGIPLVRRRSGGGTVYHDMGNALYTVFMPRENFSRRTNADVMARALNHLDIPASVNERNDIVVDRRKISGSAYKITSKRAYHHGTMLIDSDMTHLRKSLSNTKPGIKSKGVESVRSPVANLREFSYTIDYQQLNEAFMKTFMDVYNNGEPVNPIVLRESDLVTQTREAACELRQWDWLFGQTPEFSHVLENVFEWGHVSAVVKCRHGIISEVSLKTDSANAKDVLALSAISTVLQGCRYSSSEVHQTVQEASKDISALIGGDCLSLILDVSKWLPQQL